MRAGTPVICPNLGAVTEIVTNNKTGFHFRSGDPSDLARILDNASSQPNALISMRRSARADYEARYTPERGYAIIMNAYQQALQVPVR